MIKKNKLGLAGLVLASVLSFGNPLKAYANDDFTSFSNPNSPTRIYADPSHPLNPNNLMNINSPFSPYHQEDKNKKFYLSPKRELLISGSIFGAALIIFSGLYLRDRKEKKEQEDYLGSMWHRNQ